MRNRGLILILTMLVASSPSFAQLDKITQRLGIGAQSQSSDTKLASGLKEALRVVTEHSVKLTGKTDGYFKNQAIKILMPKELRTLEVGLRAVGYGSKVDGFVLSMNRAAEAAAPAARKIFTDAILSMSFDDAKRIFSGGDTAATDYFKSRTAEQLTAAFRPVIEQKMNENGVTRQYNALIGQYKSLPFARSMDLDISRYVVSKAMDGLFYTLAQQEREIRKNPVAQTTTLLREVFGK